MTAISLSDKVYMEIKKMIRDGKYLPGMALPEQELTEILGVSRTPIREALHRLQDDMIVDIKPRMGAVVASLDLYQLCNLYEVREALEGMIARLNCRKADDRGIYVNLKEKYAEALNIQDKDERHAKLNELNDEYISALSKGAKNPFISKMYLSVQEKVHTLDKVSHLIPIFPEISGKERIKVLEAIIDSDEERAEDMARLRIRNTLNRIFDAVRPR